MQTTMITDDKKDDAPHWFITAPTAEQEPQEDIVTTYPVTYSKDGIACCGTKGE